MAIVALTTDLFVFHVYYLRHNNLSDASLPVLAETLKEKIMDEKQAQFKSMTEATAEDWAIIGKHHGEFCLGLAKRLVEHLKMLDGDFGLSHSLQSASRAHRAGKDEEYVVCALLHDIGDTLGPFNHADMAATILQPFVSEKNHWIIKHHGIFQGYYFFHYLGLDRNARDVLIDHPYYQDCAEFCEEYDQNCFDSEYDSEPLSFFEPMVDRVFEKSKKSLYTKSENHV